MERDVPQPGSRYGRDDWRSCHSQIVDEHLAQDIKAINEIQIECMSRLHDFDVLYRWKLHNLDWSCVEFSGA